MARLRKKYHFLRPGVINTLKVKAYGAGASSDWSDPIDILTSEYDRLMFGALKTMSATPRWWNRVIRLAWSPAWPTSFEKEERLSHYRIMRFTPNLNPGSSWMNMSAGEKDTYVDYLAGFYKETDINVSNVFGTIETLADAGRALFYIDDDITEEQLYYYWIYAVDKRGWISGNYVGPDNAEFGKPETPTIDSFDTDIHTYN
jgi:hypothetical protein